jgi:NACHT domain
LNGLAGTGKSTIARTVAREYFEKRCLGASFFFTRGGGDVGHAGKFVTSIAVQLASSVPTLRRHISNAVTEHSDIASRSLRDQWQLLVLGPLSKLDGNGCCASYVLVVDALDECDDDNNIRIILQLLAEARSLKTVRVRVFLTSRPEVPIRHGFYQISKTEHYDFVLHNISPLIVDHDISIFLEYNLRLISEEYAQDPGWPGAEVIKTLVQSASGLFIWAATACRFIRKGLFADEKLRTLLKGGASAAATPEEHLNGIYITVLQNSIQSGFSQQDKERFCSMLRDILGSVVALFSPLSVDSLSRLLVTPKQRLDLILKDLHAILDIPNDYTRPLRLHHPSFCDFLLDKDRCGDPRLYVDEKKAHATLADHCIELMTNKLKRDICDLRALGTYAREVQTDRIEQYITNDLQYACRYWVQHLQKSKVQLDDNGKVSHFLHDHLLHWLEALSLIGKTSEGILAINSLDSMIIVSDLKCIFNEIPVTSY